MHGGTKMTRIENKQKLTDTDLAKISGGGGSWFSVNFNIDWSQARDGIRGAWDGITGKKRHY